MSRILRAVVIATLILAVAAGLAWTFRLAIAERMLLQRLADRGYPEASLAVTSLSLHRATLQDLELRPERGPTARQIEILFPLFDIAQGDVSGVEAEISGLRARLGDEAPAVLTDAPPEETTTRGGLIAALTSLARVDIHDGRVRLPPRAGREWALEFDATLRGGADGLRDAELEGQIDDRDVGLGMTISALHDGDELRAGFALLPMGRGLEGNVDLRVMPPWDNPRAELEYAARIDTDAGREPEWWPLPWPTAGSAQIAGDYRGRLGSTALPHGIDDVVQRLIAGEWHGEWRVDGNDLAREDVMDQVNVVASGEIASDGDQLTVRTAGDGFIDIGRLDPAQSRRLPLPASLARPLVTTPARIEWPAGTLARLDADAETLSLSPTLRVTYADQPMRLRLTADADWWPGRTITPGRFDLLLQDYASEPATIERLRLRGDLAAEPRRINAQLRMPRLSLEPVTATAVEATAAFTHDEDDNGGPGHWRIAEAGDIRAGEIAWPPLLTSRGSLQARITDGTLLAGEEPAWSLELAVDPAQWQAELPNMAPLALATEAHTLQLSGPSPLFPLARASIADMDARIESPALHAENLHLDVRPGRIERWLRFRTPRLHIEGGPLPLAPLRVRGHVDDWSDADQRLQGQGALAAGGADFEFVGEWPDNGAPRLQIDWPGIEFTPEGLQPGDLVPMAQRARAVAGTVRAGSELVLAGDGLDGRSHVETDNLDLRIGPASIQGLAGRVDLAGMRPWRSDGDQRLDAERVDFGLPLAAPRMRFAIQPRPGRGGVFEIREAAADYGGGRLYMPAWTWDPHADSHGFDLDVGKIDAATLVADLDIADLDVRGSLSGQLPVTLVDDRIIVRDGRLRGRDGHIAYRADAIDTSDPARNDAERAFTDLAYDRLAITINQDLDGDDTVDVGTRGRHEQVNEGETATYGVRLRGDLAPLIAAILTGEAITRAELDRHLEADDLQ